MEHFFSSNSGEDQKRKKKVFTKTETLFFPQIQVETSTQMQTRVKLLGGDADVDHTQIIGGIQSNFQGNIPPSPPPPPPPRVSAPLSANKEGSKG